HCVCCAICHSTSSCHYVSLHDALPIWIGHRRRNDTGPVEFRKIFDLIRISIRQRHGVAAPAVKGLFKMKNLMSLFLAISHVADRSEEHTSELQSRFDLVCLLLLGK